MKDETCLSLSLSLPLSVETVNDGSFHAVELVASDQTLSLSIDGGAPKSISSISKQSTLNIDSPLYLGGKDGWTDGWTDKNTSSDRDQRESASSFSCWFTAD